MSKGKTFMNISRQECLNVYKNILTNSDTKWKSATVLAEHGDYGSAFSTAIISIEELVKSILLVLDGKGFEFRNVSGIDTLFKNHKIRYILAYTMFVISVFGDDLINILMKFRNKPQLLIQLINRIKNNEVYYENKAEMYLKNKFIYLIQELDWFVKMDVFRQDGFYCDYKNSLKTPLNINAEQYKEAITKFEKVRRLGKIFIESFESNEELIKEQIKTLNFNFKKAGYYIKMGHALSTIKLNKKGPFEPLKESLANMSKKLSEHD